MDELSPAARLTEQLARLRGTPALARLRDRDTLRRLAAEALRDAPDPALREIADHLREGHGRPSDVLRFPGSAEALTRAAESSATTLDPERLVADLRSLADAQDPAAARGRPAAATHL